MRVKSRGIIASLLSKAVDRIAAMVMGFVETFACSVTRRGIETHIAEVEREKVYCRTNSMAAIKWASRKNAGYITRENRDLSGTESGQIPGYAVFRGG